MYRKNPLRVHPSGFATLAPNSAMKLFKRSHRRHLSDWPPMKNYSLGSMQNAIQNLMPNLLPWSAGTTIILILLVLIAAPSASLAGEITGKVAIWEKSPGQKDYKLAESHRNAVVFLTGFTEKADKSSGKVYNDQVNKEFVPEVMAVVRNTEVHFRNKDDTNHNIFSLSKSKKFDLGLFKSPEIKKVTFNKPGVVPIFCNIHNQMTATMLVLKNNKFAITDAEGNFNISNIPDGKHKIKVWVQGAKLFSKSVTVQADSTQNLDLPMKVLRRPAKHLNKFGKPYKKY